MVWAVEILAIPATKARFSKYSSKLGINGSSRGEDESLTDHLARWIFGNGNSVATSARGTTNEVVVARGRPATMADGALVNLARIRILSLSSNHAETLKGVRLVYSKLLGGITFLKAVVLPLGM